MKRLPFNLLFLIGCSYRLEIMPPNTVSTIFHKQINAYLKNPRHKKTNYSVEESFRWLGGPWMSLGESFRKQNMMITSLLQKREMVVAMGVKTIPFEYQLLTSLEMCPSASTCACFTTLTVLFLVA